jgi:hypothetical protein
LEKEKRRGHTKLERGRTIEEGAPSLRGGRTSEIGTPKVEEGALVRRGAHIDRKGRRFQDSKQPSEKGAFPKARACTSKA